MDFLTRKFKTNKNVLYLSYHNSYCDYTGLESGPKLEGTCVCGEVSTKKKKTMTLSLLSKKKKKKVEKQKQKQKVLVIRKIAEKFLQQ